MSSEKGEKCRQKKVRNVVRKRGEMSSEKGEKCRQKKTLRRW